MQWSPGLRLSTVEREIMRKTYLHFDKDEAKAAEALGISMGDMDTKLAQHKLRDPEFQARIDARRFESKEKIKAKEEKETPTDSFVQVTRKKGEKPKMKMGRVVIKKNANA